MLEEYKDRLENLEYLFIKEEVETSKLLGEYVVLSFVNNKAKREINLICIKDIMTNNIKVEAINIYDIASSEHISFTDWARLHEISYESFLDLLSNAALLDIVNGQSWEQVPINWQGLK